MIDFDFCSPTKIYFGKGKENYIADILSSYHMSNILIVIGQSSTRKSGLLDKVTNLLETKNIHYTILEGVRANPTTELGDKGIALAKESKPDLILAIGGGSVMDTAKYIAAGYYYDGWAFDFNMHKAQPNKSLPVGVILTISASGSELSTSCVIQDDKLQIKQGFNTDLNRPLFVIENPELTYSVNSLQTAYGIVDIMMHTLERYFCLSSDNEMCDGFAEALLKTVIKAGKRVMDNPNDYDARAELMLASSLSHNGLTSIGKKTVMPVHALEHGLSGLYPSVAHAAGLAVLFPKWARYYLDIDVDKFDLFAKNVFDSHLDNKYENALHGIELLEQFFIDLKMPMTFKDLNVGEINIDLLVDKFSQGGTRVTAHHKKNLNAEVARKIYEACL